MTAAVIPSPNALLTSNDGADWLVRELGARRAAIAPLMLNEAITVYQNAMVIFQEGRRLIQPRLSRNDLGLALHQAQRFDAAIIAHQRAVADHKGGRAARGSCYLPYGPSPGGRPGPLDIPPPPCRAGSGCRRPETRWFAVIAVILRRPREPRMRTAVPRVK